MSHSSLLPRAATVSGQFVPEGAGRMIGGWLVPRRHALRPGRGADDLSNENTTAAG